MAAEGKKYTRRMPKYKAPRPLTYHEKDMRRKEGGGIRGPRESLFFDCFHSKFIRILRIIYPQYYFSLVSTMIMTVTMTCDCLQSIVGTEWASYCLVLDSHDNIKDFPLD